MTIFPANGPRNAVRHDKETKFPSAFHKQTSPRSTSTTAEKFFIKEQQELRRETKKTSASFEERSFFFQNFRSFEKLLIYRARRAEVRHDFRRYQPITNELFS